MSDLIRLELTGRRADAWNRVFDALTGVIEHAIDHLAPSADEATRSTAKDLTRDLAEITKGFLKAKLEGPAVENELKIAEIAVKFEELKLTKARRDQVEVETDIKRVQLEKDRLALWEQRMTMALKWLGFLQSHIAQDDDGRVALVLTNQEMASLLSDFRALSSPNGPPRLTQE